MGKPKKAKPPKKGPKSAETHLRTLLETLVELHEQAGQSGSGELRWKAVDAADSLAHALAETAQVPPLRTAVVDERWVVRRETSLFWIESE